MYIWKNRSRCPARLCIHSHTERQDALKYWSDVIGSENFCSTINVAKDKLPEILKRAHKNLLEYVLYARTPLLPSYLVETNNGYGISIEWIVDEEHYALHFGLTIKDVAQKMEELLMVYKGNYALRGSDIHLFKYTKMEGNVVAFVFPADIPTKRIRFAMETIIELNEAIDLALRLEGASNTNTELQYSIPLKLKEKINREYSIDFEGDNMIRFGRYSPAGQDFGFSVNAGEDLFGLMRNVEEAHQSFDCSEEAYLWLDNTGHGKDGAPYDMKDVYEDMECCREYIEELRQIISDYLDSEDDAEPAAELQVPKNMH